MSEFGKTEVLMKGGRLGMGTIGDCCINYTSFPQAIEFRVTLEVGDNDAKRKTKIGNVTQPQAILSPWLSRSELFRGESMQFNELKLNLCELKQATSGGGCSGAFMGGPRGATGKLGVSDVPAADIPCYPKHEAVISQDLPYGSHEGLRGALCAYTSPALHLFSRRIIENVPSINRFASTIVISLNFQLIPHCPPPSSPYDINTITKPGEKRVGCCVKWGGYDRGGCSATLRRQLLVIPSVSRGRWELDGAYFRSEGKKKDIIAI
ncbi:hypothetical protein V1478_009525 [Vespula squamosa]|uniref:Uncharacterized protein n=1 Tax=Vespula squamosa TaxID=30214 RepID=A0ABD2AQT5_VESSQ